MSVLSKCSWALLLSLSGCPNLDIDLPSFSNTPAPRPPPIHAPTPPPSETHAGQNSGQQCRFEPLPSGMRTLGELRDAALREHLHASLQGKRGLSYASARDHMYKSKDGKRVAEGGPYTGFDVDAKGDITCVYTGLRFKADGSRTPAGHGSSLNTEHTWPRSKGAEAFPAEGDPFHLFPTEQEANSRRSNYEFGNVACGGTKQPACRWEQGGSKLGPSSDARGSLVFEVRNAHRGDVARALFYFSVAYKRPINPEEEAVLREWNCQDPPDAKEKARNDAIEKVIGVRNPFIDAPSLVYRIRDF